MAKAKAEKADKDLARVQTPMFRVSYPHVFEAKSVKPGDKAKFSITMLFPKDSDLSGLKEAIKQAKIAAFGPKKSDWPEGLQSPVIDGDNPKYKDKEGYAGCWVIKASTNEDQRPAVVDEDLNPILKREKFYAGCYARAYIYAYAWEYMGKEGIGFILDGVQKLEDGKSFGGKKSVEQMFAPVAKKKKATQDFDDDEEDGDEDEETDFL